VLLSITVSVIPSAGAAAAVDAYRLATVFAIVFAVAIAGSAAACTATAGTSHDLLHLSPAQLALNVGKAHSFLFHFDFL
jgi:hypothetical protein